MRIKPTKGIPKFPDLECLLVVLRRENWHGAVVGHCVAYSKSGEGLRLKRLPLLAQTARPRTWRKRSIQESMPSTSTGPSSPSRHFPFLTHGIHPTMASLRWAVARPLATILWFLKNGAVISISPVTSVGWTCHAAICVTEFTLGVVNLT